MPYEYKFTFKKVIDGDTIVGDIDLGFDVVLANQYIRLIGIDTPESKSSDKIEKMFGNLSKQAVKSFMDLAAKNPIIIKTFLAEDNSDKYGRVLGEIFNSDNVSLNDWLVASNYAVKYHGQNKDFIKKAHLSNRKILIDSKVINISYAEAGIS